MADIYRARNQCGEAAVRVGTTGGAVVGMPNYGVSIVSATSTEVYTLAPPVAGCRKTIVCTSSSTGITPTIKLSSNAAQTVSLTQLGGNQIATMFKFAATRSTGAATVVELVGINSTSWVMTNAFPCLSTGAGNGAVTLSTT